MLFVVKNRVCFEPIRESGRCDISVFSVHHTQRASGDYQKNICVVFRNCVLYHFLLKFNLTSISGSGGRTFRDKVIG
jgi:hypothetical protein